MDRGSSLVQTACQGIFILVLTVFLLSWFLNKIKKYFTRSITDISGVGVADTEPGTPDSYKHKQDECRQRMQEEHESKVLHQKEKARKQEEAMRHKKKKDFYQFSDPVFLTDGATLGRSGSGSDNDDDDDAKDIPEARRAASKRKVLEHINQRFAAEVAAVAAAAKPRPKRIIKLPEEPGVNEDGALTVMLRTPIGTVCQRRFYASDTIQCLLDYITTQGFSQTRYAVSTSYPRKLLENPQACFSDYNFGMRVALNIEEKD
ncbi:hypothetical protein BsWGS_20447 [Bradybaena similaris]